MDYNIQYVSSEEAAELGKRVQAFQNSEGDIGKPGDVNGLIALFPAYLSAPDTSSIIISMRMPKQALPRRSRPPRADRMTPHRRSLSISTPFLLNGRAWAIPPKRRTSRLR